jgi:biotin carboxylase
MGIQHKPTILFMSSTYKGIDAIKEAAQHDCFVLLLTEAALRDAPWPYDAIDEFFLTPDLTKYQDVVNTVAYLCRGRRIDLIIPLDEFELELAAMLREHLRIQGNGVTLSRSFRDKLTMREKTARVGVRVPPFVGVKNYDDLRDYMRDVPPPWVLKPRAEASAMGIRKMQDAEQVWRTLDTLGDLQTYYLLEKFIPGDVFHVDSIVADGEIVFSSVQRYGNPPMKIYQGGGVFTSRVLPYDSYETQTLKGLNAYITRSLGLTQGVTHAEYICAHEDGEFYFLEVAARVGGANIADMIEAATNVNLWREWVRVELARLYDQPYQLPPLRQEYAGILISLARQEYPDTSAYDDPEIVWRSSKKNHAGLIVASWDQARVEYLLSNYEQRFMQDFLAIHQPKGEQRTGRTG